MAFDDAAGDGAFASAGGYGPRGEAATDALVAQLSSRTVQLAQTLGAIEKLVDQLGTAADSVAFRQRLSAAETKAEALRTEIDNGARRLRVEGAAGAAPKQAERLLQQYNELRARLQTVVRNSQAKQRQIKVPEPTADGYSSLSSPTGAKGAGRGGASAAAAASGTGSAMEMSSIRVLDDVDEAIVEERRREAAHIAREALEVRGAMQDISVLVAEQGEQINKVEANVDKSVDAVLAANKDLTIAAKYQASYRKKCCFFWLLVLIVIAAIAVPVALHFANKSN